MGTKIQLQTSKGDITIELDDVKAPASAANFIEYVKAGHYDGTVFHRVIPGFMIQGGGFEPGMKQKPTRAPIQNESANGLTNDHYTIAMARTSAPHSASSQFFINATDNGFLNKAQSQEVHKLFESLSADVENSFLHLGLTHVQEEHLSGIIKQYMEAVLQTLDQSQEVEQFLGRVINKLSTYA